MSWRRSSLPLLSMVLLAGFAQAQDDDPKVLAIEWNNKGVQALEAGKLDEAIAALDKAYRYDGSSASIKKNLAEAYRRRGDERLAKKDFAHARVDYRSAIHLAPDERLYHFGAAYVTYKEEAYEEACKEFAKVIERFPELADAYYLLGDCHLRLQDKVQAVAIWRRGLKIDPEHEGMKQAVAKHGKDADVEKDLYEEEHGTFVFKYDLYQKDVARYAPTLAEDLDAAFRACQTFFLYHLPKEKIRVLLYQEKDFRNVTGLDHWVGGVFDGRIRIPVNHYQKERVQLMKTMRHEMAHAFARDLSQRTPTWLHEGWAQMMEDASVDRARSRVKEGGLTTAAILWGSFLQLKDVKAIRGAYDTSLVLTAKLERDYGRYGLIEFLKALNEHPEQSPAEVFEERFYLTLDQVLERLAREL